MVKVVVFDRLCLVVLWWCVFQSSLELPNIFLNVVSSAGGKEALSSEKTFDFELLVASSSNVF